MFKLMWMLKRKPGITFEQFREHYESSHSVIGQKYLGHLILDYKRNYNRSFEGGVTPPERASEFDCVTIWEMPDQAAFDECMRLLADPVIGAVFREDEEKFLAKDGSRFHFCDCRDTGPGDGAETLKLMQAAGQ